MFDHDIVMDYLVRSENQRASCPVEGCSEFGDGVIFVVGCPRSGTTLLGNALSQAGWAAGGEEFLFMLDMYRMYSGLYLEKNGPKVSPNLKSYITSEDILTKIGQFCDNLYKEMRRERYIIDHTPFNAEIIGFIRQILPKSRFVHIIRNGLDVEASLMHSFNKGYTWAGSNVESRASRWVSSIETVLNEQVSAPFGSIVELRYEELCAAPREQLLYVTSALGLPFDSEMLSAFRVAHAAPSRPLRSCSSDRLQFDRDRSVLSTADDATFRKIAGAMMIRLGYEASS